MKKYYANFKVNNGTSFITPMDGTNKAKLIDDVRSISEANRFIGNSSRWWVFTIENEGAINSRHLVVAEGGNDCGRRWRNHDVPYYL